MAERDAGDIQVALSSQKRGDRLAHGKVGRVGRQVRRVCRHEHIVNKEADCAAHLNLDSQSVDRPSDNGDVRNGHRLRGRARCGDAAPERRPVSAGVVAEPSEV